MSTNREDIDQGRQMIESGEAVRYDELREGDVIVGVGEVEYVHLHNGGLYVHVVGDGFNVRRGGELMVSIEPSQECPRCQHVNHKAPMRRTFQGAAEFYCDGCERFFQVFAQVSD